MVAGVLAAIVAGVYVRNALARQAGSEKGAARRFRLRSSSVRTSFRIRKWKASGRSIRCARRGRRNSRKAAGTSSKMFPSACTDKRASAMTSFARAPVILFRTPGKSLARGKFRSRCRQVALLRANAIQVSTSGISFDQRSGEARTDKTVTFRWPGGEGSALGVDYDSNDGTLSLERNVDVTTTGSSAPLPGKTEGVPGKVRTLDRRQPGISPRIADGSGRGERSRAADYRRPYRR